MKVADIDVWRSATLLLREHGQAGAWVAAVSRVRELDQAGDHDGVAVWNRIVDAVEELSRSVPSPGEIMQ